MHASSGLAVVIVVMMALFLAACGNEESRPIEGPGRPTYYERDKLTAAMEHAVLADPIVQTIIGSNIRGQDYWVDPVPLQPNYGEEGGLVLLVFSEPVSWEGEELIGSQPCEGQHGGQYRGPCLQERREFDSATRKIVSGRVISATVDVLTGKVFNIGQEHFEADSIQQMIADLSAEDSQPASP